MIQNTPAQWDRVVDVVVVGSGGGALVAATLAHDGGAEVLIVEKDEMLGGTTAVSGGGIWLPGNHVMEELAGITDNREDALAYIRRVTMGREPDPALLEVYVDTAREMLRYLEDHTPLRCHIQPLPDYYNAWGLPGSIPVPARTVEANPFPVGTVLPEWKDRIVKRGALMSLGAATTLTEDQSPKTPELEAELARREREDIRPKGAALVAALFKGLLDRGVQTWLSSPARELVVADGDVVGVRVEREGRSTLIGARRGVILACGGFEWNPDLVRAHIGYDVHPLSPGGNTGDGLAMAEEVGAELANLTSYWGTPVMFDPGVTRDGRLVPQFEWGRGAPASIVVNRHGRRFANEALPYNDFPKAFGIFDPDRIEFPNAAPGFLIFDQSVRDAQQILSMLPGRPTPDWVVRAETIRALAEAVRIDPDALQATVDRFNEHARCGEDPDFDRTRHGLMAPGLVAPIERPPFYAVEIHPGALGTNGGPRVDRNGQVRRRGGGLIGGLYAAGNAAANVFGWAYPSGGGTLGNATVFGYLAGRHAAAQPARDLAGGAARVSATA